ALYKCRITVRLYDTPSSSLWSTRFNHNKSLSRTIQKPHFIQLEVISTLTSVLQSIRKLDCDQLKFENMWKIKILCNIKSISFFILRHFYFAKSLLFHYCEKVRNH